MNLVRIQEQPPATVPQPAPESAAAVTATLGLSIAWINNPEVKIPVR